VTVAPRSAHPGRGRRRSRWAFLAILAFLLGGLTVSLVDRSVSRSSTPETSPVRASASTAAVTTPASSGRTSQARDVAAFHGVELRGTNNVVVHVGAKQSVVVRADASLLSRVTTKVQSGTLVIGNTPGSFSSKSPMRVEVGVPSLDALTLTGNGTIVVDGIAADSLHVTLPGNGTLTARGTATRLDLTVSGSGTAQFEQLVADDAHAVLSGSGAIFLTATRTLDASVSGSGVIRYGGNPHDVSERVTGSGAINGSRS
jgi:hypothetical protein